MFYYEILAIVNKLRGLFRVLCWQTDHALGIVVESPQPDAGGARTCSVKPDLFR